MKMRNLTPQQYRAGYKLEKPIMSSQGNPLFLEGHILNHEDIKTLHAFLVPSITVEDTLAGDQLVESLVAKDLSSVDPVFTDIYSILIDQTEQLFQQFKQKVKTDFYAITKVVYPFIEYGLNHNSAILFDFPKLIHPEKYMYHHAVLVSLFVGLIANKAKFEKKEIFEAAIAGYLHNTGQLFVPDQILNKPGALSEQEFTQIQKHPVLGYDFLVDIPYMPNQVALAVQQHHEREDGSGYPNGLKSAAIHKYAKIIAIADYYVAMCSTKLYRPAQSPFRTIEQIKNDSFGRLDRTYVQYFLEFVASKINIGKKVTLNNGWSGEIIYVDPNAVTQPIIRCSDQMVNLQIEKELYIERVD